ncbi:uncharacterized protein LOC662247 isoform X2 [Tribolium castaneum]|nr:PREDICTED: uncharacterized protein LOC662247 isoform X1 [Tribolium castaneum]|eukprot:XP_973451.2 PREDICTED: uncharacterized protein LOC662247 isoform X1 [Tribolium castaneum]
MSRQSYLAKIVVFLVLMQLCSLEKTLSRRKRFLYFPNGGTFKLVLGFATPVKLGLKQSMAWGWNFQFQYAEPQTPNNTRIYPPIVGRSRIKRDGRNDRALFYSAIEDILNRNGFSGRACLLRSICENALYSLHHEANGLYGHLLHIALTPDYGDGKAISDLDPVYLEAKKAGEFGVDCSSLYPDCSGSGLLDTISLLE